MKTQRELALHLWKFISKPFQITRVLELLYLFDWSWYVYLSSLPAQNISGALFVYSREYVSNMLISLFLLSIVLMHAIGLLFDIIWLRKAMLLWNFSVLLYISARVLLQTPVSSGIGYTLILGGITLFAFLRMDKAH